VLVLEITSIVVLPVLALFFYVVSRSQPGRFRLSATLLRLVSISIEVDAQEKPDELPVALRMPPWTQLSDHNPAE
jgi:hypothetical protein